MSQLFTVHTALVNGLPHYFLCKPVTYEGISSQVGVEEAGDDVGVFSVVRVSELLRRGLLLRVNLYYLVGNRRRIGKVLCRPDKMKSFMFLARGSTYRGGIVGTATTPSKNWRR